MDSADRRQRTALLAKRRRNGEGAACLDKISPDEVFEAVEKKMIREESEKNGR